MGRSLEPQDGGAEKSEANRLNKNAVNCTGKSNLPSNPKARAPCLHASSCQFLAAPEQRTPPSKEVPKRHERTFVPQTERVPQSCGPCALSSL